MKTRTMAILPLTLAALLMAGCSGGEKAADDAQNATTAKNGAASEEGGHADEEGEIDLSADQIRKAGVELVRVIRSGGGALTLPATIEGDPQGMQVVSAAIGGRVVSLTRNLGQSVGRGQRSEEHTSELQSLMRTSYAVFCLIKTNIKQLRR